MNIIIPMMRMYLNYSTESRIKCFRAAFISNNYIYKYFWYEASNELLSLPGLHTLDLDFD